jgi:hypothetical protein
MNKRSFKRGMKPPQPKEGWERKKQESRHLHGPLQDQLRAVFEEILRNALSEMAEQAAQGVGKPINSWGALTAENGMAFKLTLECQPATIPTIPSLN